MMNSWIVFVLLISISCYNVQAIGWWLTIPSANEGCGSMTTDSYYWDTEDLGKNNKSGKYPRGDYEWDMRQYFCTGNVDLLPLGSYCFYQNIQNGMIIWCFIRSVLILFIFSFEY